MRRSLALLTLMVTVAPSAGASSPFGINAHIPGPLLVERVDELGVGWARLDFVWAFVEPEPGAWDWSLYDSLIAALEARDVEIFATLQGTPAWATSGPEFSGPPDDPDRWRDFCFRAADRYRGRVAAWGLWNEPNLDHFWSGSRSQFIAEMLLPGAEALSVADPDALVVGGDLAHLSSGHWDTWLETVASEGRYVLDVIAHHVYPSDESARDVTDDLVSGGSYPWEPPSVLEVLQDAGWWGRPFWLTETGVTTNPPGSENLQDSFYRNLIVTWFGGNDTDWIQRLFFYELADDPNNPDAWGVYGPPPDYMPKRAAGTYHDLIEATTYDDAEIVSVDAPPTIGSLASVDISVRVRNSGTTTWSNAAAYRFRVWSDRESWGVDDGFLPRDREVRPGGTLDLTFEVRTTRLVDEPVAPALIVGRMGRGPSRFGDSLRIPLQWTDQPRPGLAAEFRTIQLRPGDDVTLSVVADETTVESLRWHRNTVRVRNEPRLAGATTPELRIRTFEPDLAGLYEIVATGPGGVTRHEVARLLVAQTGSDESSLRRERRRTELPGRWHAWHSHRRGGPRVTSTSPDALVDGGPEPIATEEP